MTRSDSFVGRIKGFTSSVAGWFGEESARQREALRYLASGEYVAAESTLVGALDEAEQKKFSTPRRLEIMLQLADTQRKQAAQPGGDPEGEWIRAAEETVRQSLELAAGVSNPLGYLEGLHLFAQILCDQSRWAAAEKVLLEAVRLHETVKRAKSSMLIQLKFMLGLAQTHIGKHEEARLALAEALELQKKHFGAESVETATFIASIGKMLRLQGQHEAAQEHLRLALRTHRAVLGETSREVFDDLLNLGGSLEDAGDLEGAAGQFETALQIKHRQLGVSHLEPLAEMQYSLASIYIGWDNYSRARELLIECIGTFRRTGGPRLAVCYETLAQVEESCGHHNIAIRELENAGKAWERCGHDKLPELIHNLEYRADLFEEMRTANKAVWLRERATQLRNSLGIESLDSGHLNGHANGHAGNHVNGKATARATT